MGQTARETASMFGAFNLRKGIALPQFHAAFDAFCAHLQETGHVLSWRVMERAYHDGYDSGFPDVHVIIEMCFPSQEAAQLAWDYIETGSDPLRGLHLALIRQIEDSRFVLCQER